MIYFVAYGDSGLTKIGYATHMGKRLSQLQVSSPECLTVVALIEGTNAQEKALHAALRSERKRGEWFHPMSLTNAAVERAKADLSIGEIISLAEAEAHRFAVAVAADKSERRYAGWAAVANNPREWDNMRDSCRQNLLNHDEGNRLTEEARAFVPRPSNEYAAQRAIQWEKCRQTGNLHDLLQPEVVA